MVSLASVELQSITEFSEYEYQRNLSFLRSDGALSLTSSMNLTSLDDKEVIALRGVSIDVPDTTSNNRKESVEALHNYSQQEMSTPQINKQVSEVIDQEIGKESPKTEVSEPLTREERQIENYAKQVKSYAHNENRVRNFLSSIYRLDDTTIERVLKKAKEMNKRAARQSL